MEGIGITLTLEQKLFIGFVVAITLTFFGGSVGLVIWAALR